MRVAKLFFIQFLMWVGVLPSYRWLRMRARAVNAIIRFITYHKAHRSWNNSKMRLLFLEITLTKPLPTQGGALPGRGNLREGQGTKVSDSQLMPQITQKIVSWSAAALCHRMDMDMYFWLFLAGYTVNSPAHRWVYVAHLCVHTTAPLVTPCKSQIVYRLNKPHTLLIGGL